MTAGWRECADPVVLAAAVAAGVDVRCVAVDGRTWETGCEDSESFRRCMANDCRYRVPSSWSWSPEPPADVPTGAERYLAERLADPEYRAAYEAAAPVTGDDLRERIARAIYEEEHDGPWKNANHPDWVQSLRSADAVLAVLPPQPAPSPVPPWPGDDDWCGAVLNDLNSIIHQHCGSDGSDDAHCDWVNDLANEVVRYFQRPDVLPAPPPVPSWPDGVLRDAANRLRWIANSGYIEDPGIKRIIRSWVDELDATPVPPWPGAVLSGLVDEDGVPTWLAQAGQVRGEQVRRRSDLVWVNNDQMVAFPDTVWVEVRAPRAVAEPATERVPWWAAVGREVTDQDGERVPIEHVQCGDGAGPSVTAYNAAERRDTRLLRVPIPVRGDGTVEVLKDGDR